MSAYKHTPFPGSRRFTVSRCIGTCLRTYCRDRHQPRRATSEIAGNFISTRLSPNTSASSRAWLDAIAKYTEHKRSLCDGCISLSIAEGLVSGVSAFFFLPVSGPYFIPVFLTFKVFFSLFTLLCSQTCEQTFVNKAQNIFKVNFYPKGNSSFSSTFTNPSGSFFGRIRFHER